MAKSKGLEDLMGIAKTEVFCGDTTVGFDGEHPTYAISTTLVNLVGGASGGAALGGVNGTYAGFLIGVVYSVLTYLFGDAGNALRKNPIIHYE